MSDREDDSLREIREYGKKPSISGYEIGEEIGRGGMGVVYLAIQQSLEREVAVKMIRYLDTAADVTLFQREAKLAASLSHPHIVIVYDSGQAAGGEYFIAMEYVRGEGLDKLIASGPVDFVRALEIVRDIASALVYAHNKDIIHRDLKPSNIYLDSERDGCARLMDFGLARRSQGTVTQSGAIRGTLMYMAPEQIEG